MEILESYTVGYVGLNVTPHNQTQRLYITPPSNRRYHVSQIFLYMYRTTDATAQGLSRIHVNIQRGTESEITIAMIHLYGTSIGTREVMNVTTDITLYPGDTLRAYTTDTSTGGNISFWITINYDAIP